MVSLRAFALAITTSVVSGSARRGGGASARPERLRRRGLRADPDADARRRRTSSSPAASPSCCPTAPRPPRPTRPPRSSRRSSPPTRSRTSRTSTAAATQGRGQRLRLLRHRVLRAARRRPARLPAGLRQLHEVGRERRGRVDHGLHEPGPRLRGDRRPAPGHERRRHPRRTTPANARKLKQPTRRPTSPAPAGARSSAPRAATRSAIPVGLLAPARYAWSDPYSV